MTPNPFTLFAGWFAKAAQANIPKPNALTLSTVAADGRPTSRIVLLSSFDERGFVFHTNYQSAKANDLAHNARVALVFWWDPLGYQVRIEGRAEKTSPQESDAYFAKRPRRSQLSAWASEQSQQIESRVVLESRMEQLEQQYSGVAVPRPPHWGGYRVRPEVIEFWEDRRDRLHDRVRFERVGEAQWRSVRVAP